LGLFLWVKGMAKKYNAEDRRRAALVYASYGSYAKVEEDTGYNQRTVKMWHDTCKVFNDALKKIDASADKSLSRDFQKFVQKGITHALDAIDNYDPEKIKFKDLIWSIAVIHDKRQVLEGKAVAHTGQPQHTNEMLDDLAKALDKRRADHTKQESKNLSVVSTTHFKAS